MWLQQNGSILLEIQLLVIDFTISDDLGRKIRFWLLRCRIYFDFYYIWFDFLFFIFGCLVQHSLPSLYPLNQPWTLHLVSGAFGSTVHHQIYCEITILRYKTLAVVFSACADNDSFLYSYLLDDHWYARVIFLSWNPHHLTLLLLPLSQRHTKAVLKSEVTGYTFTHTLQCSLRQQSLLWKCWDLVISIGVLKSQFR